MPLSRAQRLTRFAAHIEALQQPVWPEAERRQAQAAAEQFVATATALADGLRGKAEIRTLRDLLAFYQSAAPVVKRLVNLLETVQNPVS